MKHLELQSSVGLRLKMQNDIAKGGTCMKKLISLVLVACFLSPLAVLADVLSPDWQNASLDELLSAQQQIGDQISALRAAEKPAGEAIELSGTGTSILSSVEIPQVPARVTINGNVKVTMTGGRYDQTFNAWQYDFSCESLTEAGTYDLLIEGEGSWSIAIEPLKEGGTMALSGNGPYISDFFELSAPTIVHCSMDASKTDGYFASLYTKLGHQYSNIENWTSDTVVGDLVSGNQLKLEADGIIKKEGNRTQYYWIIDVPIGTEWSITTK